MDTFAALVDLLAGPNGEAADTEDEEEQDGVQMPSPQREILVNIDNEMAIARELLGKLTQRRNEVHMKLFRKNAPSAEEQKIFLATIAEKEAQLTWLSLEDRETRNELGRLLNRETSEISSTNVFDFNQEDKRSESKGNNAFNEQVRFYEAHLGHLINRQKSIQADLEIHRTALTPIRKLPPEIISSIFLQSLPDDDFMRPSPATPPLLLTIICSSWRNIALNIPDLWSSISINMISRAPLPNVPLIRCWVQRSGLSGLSFQVIEESNLRLVPPTSTSPLLPILEIFIPHYARWRKVHLTYGNTRSLKTGFRILPPDAVFPMLESLYVDKQYWIEQEDTERITSMVLSAPRLRSIGWMCQQPYTTLSFPWAQLSHFSHGQLIPMEEAFQILSDCPVLQDVELYLIIPSFQSLDDISSDIVVHNTLESLIMHGVGVAGIFLRRLKLPRLKRLSLEMIAESILLPTIQALDWSSEAFISFLSRSGCTLDFLSLSEFDLQPKNLIGCLRHCSMTLKELHLNNERARERYVDDEVLRLMTYWSALSDTSPTEVEEDEETPLCPYIHSLKLWGCISSTDGLLTQMLDSRWRPRRKHCKIDQLQVVLIGLHADPQHPLDEERVRRMNEQKSGVTVIRL